MPATGSISSSRTGVPAFYRKHRLTKLAYLSRVEVTLSYRPRTVDDDPGTDPGGGGPVRPAACDPLGTAGGPGSGGARGPGAARRAGDAAGHRGDGRDPAADGARARRDDHRTGVRLHHL